MIETLRDVVSGAATPDRPSTILENLADRSIQNVVRLHEINDELTGVLTRLDGPTLAEASKKTQEPTSETTTALQRTLGATANINNLLDEISNKIVRLNEIV